MNPLDWLLRKKKVEDNSARIEQEMKPLIQKANARNVQKLKSGQINRSQYQKQSDAILKNQDTSVRSLGNGLIANTKKDNAFNTALNNLSSGVMSVAPQRIAGGIAEYGGTLIGNKNVRDWGTRQSQPFRDFNAVSYENAGNKALATGSQIAGNLLTLPLAPTKLGVGVGINAGSKALPRAVPMATRAFMAGAPTAADTSYAIRQGGGSENAQRIGGGAVGVVSGTLNSLGGEKILSPFSKKLASSATNPLTKVLSSKLVNSVPGRIAIAGNNEGLEEVVEQGVDNLVAQKTYDKDRNLTDNLALSYGLGAGMGGIVRGGVELGNPTTQLNPTLQSKRNTLEIAQSQALNNGRPDIARRLGDEIEQIDNPAPGTIRERIRSAKNTVVDKWNRDTALPNEVDLSEDELLTLTNWGDYKARVDDPSVKAINTLAPEAYATAEKAGLDITSGSPLDIQSRITDFVEDYKFRQNAKPQGGFIAGPLAGDFSEFKKQGKVFEGVDGKPRFEVDDSGAKLNTEPLNPANKLTNLESQYGMMLQMKKMGVNNPDIDARLKVIPEEIRQAKLASKSTKKLKLSDVLDHEAMYKQYPELRDVNVKVVNNRPFETKAAYDPRTNTVELNKKRLDTDPEDVKSNILHEVQHAIQEKEGFATGGYDKNMNTYNRLAGEAEARAVASRMNMSEGERYKTPEGEKLYHGSTEKFDGEARFPLYTTPNKDYANIFATSTAASSIAKSGKKLNDGGKVHEFVLNPKARVLDITNPAHRKLLEEQYFGKYSMSYDPVTGKNGHMDWTEGENLAEWIDETKQPFDAIKLDEGGGGVDPQFGVKVPEKGVSVLALNKNAVQDAKPQSTFYDSLDVPKEDLIIRDGSGKAMSIDPSAPQVGKTVAPVETKKPFTPISQPVDNTPAVVKAVQKPVKVTASDSSLATSPELSVSSPRNSGQESALQVKAPQKIKSENQVQLDSRQKSPLPTNNTTKVKLNTGRLNPKNADALAEIDSQTSELIEKLSNKDLERLSKDAGIDTVTHTPEQVKKKIAEQLNVRRDAVRYMNESEVARKAGDTELAKSLMLKAAEQGRISRAQGSELAQQLQARRIIANELDTPQQRIFKLLDAAGINPEAYVNRLSKVDFNEPKQVVEAYRDLVPAKKAEWLDTLRYNSMLSSPLTQAVNVFGNAQGVLGVAPIEKTLRGTIDAISSAFSSKPRQYVAGEGLAYSKGTFKNIGNATRNFKDALNGTGKYANPDFQDYNIPLATKGLSGAAYKGLSFPMRVLDGMDKFFRTLAEGGEESALDLRVKKGIDLKGNKAGLMEKEASYRVFQQELKEPGQGVLNNAADEFASLVMSGRNSKNPIVSTVSKFTVPFVKTINNINKQGIVDYSPVGYINTIGNADKITAVTRATMGTAVFGLAALMVGSGNMTWAEPRDPEEKAKFKADGKQAYAIKIGGNWFNFSKLHPSVAFPMAMTAALDDAMKNGKADQSQVDKILEAVAKYGNFMADQSYAKSIGDTLGAIGGDKESIVRAVSNYPQQVVPMRAFTSWIARMTDPLERKINTDGSFIEKQVESFMQQYPGLRQKTTTRDYEGQPIPANNQVLNSFSPIRVTTDRTDGTETQEVQSARPKGQIAITDKTEKNDKGDYVSRDKYDAVLNAYEKSDSKHGLNVKENTLGNIQNYDSEELKKAIKDVADEGKKAFETEGLPFPDMRADSTFARDYASFKKGLEGKDPLKVREDTKSFFKTSYKNTLDETSRSFYTLGDDDMRTELENGTITKAQMDKIIALDDMLTANGLQDYLQVGKTLRAELGYGGTVAKGGRKSSGRGGRNASKKASDLTAIQSNNATFETYKNLDRLLASARSGSKSGVKKVAVRKPTLKQIKVRA